MSGWIYGCKICAWVGPNIAFYNICNFIFLFAISLFYYNNASVSLKLNANKALKSQWSLNKKKEWQRKRKKKNLGWYFLLPLLFWWLKSKQANRSTTKREDKRVWKSKGRRLDGRRKRIMSESHKSSLLNPPTGRPRQLSFFFYFYWSMDIQYYLSYRCTIQWFTIFKDYIPFIVIIKYWLHSPCCTIYPYS